MSATVASDDTNFAASVPTIPPTRPVVIAACLCGILLAIPFWVGRFLPMLDLPQHTAVVSILRHFDDPQWNFKAFFVTEWWELTPYWLFYFVTYVLSQVVSVETAARLYLSLYALAWPWAAIVLLRGLRQHPALGLCLAPLALNVYVYFGFINYCSGLVVFCFAIALLMTHLKRVRLWTSCGLMLCGALLFFAHVQILGFFLMSAVVLALWRGDATRSRSRILACWPLLPPVCGLLLPWLFVSFAGGARRDFGTIEQMAPHFNSFWTNIMDLPFAIAGAFQDRTDAWLLIVWLIQMMILMGTGSARIAQGDRLRGPAVVLMALALAGYFLAPMSIRGQWNINQRFAILAVLFVPGLVLRVTPRMARVLPWSAVALTALVSSNAVVHHLRFDREAGALDAALARLPWGQRVLPLIYDNRGEVLEKWPYLHIGQYAMVRRGGTTSHTLAQIGAFPVARRADARLPIVDPWRPKTFDFARQGRSYDYFLIREERLAGVSPFRDHEREVRCVFREGPWSLYERMDAGNPAQP